MLSQIIFILLFLPQLCSFSFILHALSVCYCVYMPVCIQLLFSFLSFLAFFYNKCLGSFNCQNKKAIHTHGERGRDRLKKGMEAKIEAHDVHGNLNKNQFGLASDFKYLYMFVYLSTPSFPPFSLQFLFPFSACCCSCV